MYDVSDTQIPWYVFSPSVFSFRHKVYMPNQRYAPTCSGRKACQIVAIKP